MRKLMLFLASMVHTTLPMHIMQKTQQRATFITKTIVQRNHGPSQLSQPFYIQKRRIAAEATLAAMTNPVTAPVVIAVATTTGIALGAKFAYDQCVGDNCGNKGDQDKAMPTCGHKVPAEYTPEEQTYIINARAEAGRQYHDKVVKGEQLPDELLQRFDTLCRGENREEKLAAAEKTYFEKGREEKKESRDDKNKDTEKGNKSGDKDKDKNEKDERIQRTPEDLRKGIKEIKEDYEYVKEKDAYKLRENGDPIEKDGKVVELIRKDHTHNELETYGKNKQDLGPIDPITKEPIPNKPADPTRKL